MYICMLANHYLNFFTNYLFTNLFVCYFFLLLFLLCYTLPPWGTKTKANKQKNPRHVAVRKQL